MFDISRDGAERSFMGHLVRFLSNMNKFANLLLTILRFEIEKSKQEIESDDRSIDP